MPPLSSLPWSDPQAPDARPLLRTMAALSLSGSVNLRVRELAPRVWAADLVDDAGNPLFTADAAMLMLGGAGPNPVVALGALLARCAAPAHVTALAFDGL